MFDGKAWGQEIVGVVKAHVDKATAPLLESIKNLKAEIAELTEFLTAKPIGPDEIEAIIRDAVAAVRRDHGNEIQAIRGQVAALPAVPELPDIPAMIAEAIAPLPKSAADLGVPELIASAIAAIPPQEPKEFDPEPARQIAQQIVASALAALPAPEKGMDADEVRTLIQEAIAALPEPKGFDVEEVRPLVKAEAEAAVAALPVPKNGEPGKDVDMVLVKGMIDEATYKAIAGAVAGIPKPKDGKDGIDAMDVMIDRDGNLVVTMSDGRIKTVGKIVGRDGADVDMAAVERRVKEMFDAWPKPKDGKDGVGFDDLDLVETDEGLFLRCVRGENVKEWRLPVPLDRGVYKEGQTYRRGDAVSFGGSMFIAQRETTAKPETVDSGWRMGVKRGRDGKPGEMKPPRDPKPVKVG